MNTTAGGGIHRDGAVPLLGGADIPQVVVSGCEEHSLKMPERCEITLSTQGKPLVAWLGWFLLPVPDHQPQADVQVLPPILGKTSILLLMRFLGAIQVSSFAEDKAGWLK